MSSLLSPAPSAGRGSRAEVTPPRVRQRAPLVRDTLRAHRVGAAVWIVAGGLTMLGMGAAVATEMADFPGGPQALAASVAAGAEAMRLLRWPAERLDTLGGYVTYHNVILFNVLLAIYGVIQGARDIRGGEERGTPRAGAGHRPWAPGGGPRPRRGVRAARRPHRPGPGPRRRRPGWRSVTSRTSAGR